MISIFITSRVAGNANSNIERLVASLKEKSADISNFELLVKYDEDDENKDEKIQFLRNCGLSVKTLIGKRERGYEDIHKGYQSLIPLASSKAQVFTCFADDFYIVQNAWDKNILKMVETIHHDFFIIHQRNHPPSSRLFFDKIKYYPYYDTNNFSTLHIIDEAPMWSVNLIRLLNSFGNISFTDAWTLYVEKMFADFYKLDITYFTKQPIIYRNLDDNIDGEGATRWHTSRKRNFEYINTPIFYDLTKREVDSIAQAIKNRKSSFFKYKARFYLNIFRQYAWFKIYSIFGRFLKYFSPAFAPTTQPFLLCSFLENNVLIFEKKYYLVPQSSGEINFNDSHFLFNQAGKAFFVSTSFVVLYFRALGSHLFKLAKRKVDSTVQVIRFYLNIFRQYAWFKVYSIFGRFLKYFSPAFAPTTQPFLLCSFLENNVLIFEKKYYLVPQSSGEINFNDSHFLFNQAGKLFFVSTSFVALYFRALGSHFFRLAKRKLMKTRD